MIGFEILEAINSNLERNILYHTIPNNVVNRIQSQCLSNFPMTRLRIQQRLKTMAEGERIKLGDYFKRISAEATQAANSPEVIVQRERNDECFEEKESSRLLYEIADPVTVEECGRNAF